VLGELELSFSRALQFGGMGFRVYKLCFHCAFHTFVFLIVRFTLSFLPYSAFHTLFVLIVRLALSFSPLGVWRFLFPHCAFGAFFFLVVRLALTRECDLLFWTSILSSSSSSSFFPFLLLFPCRVFFLYFIYLFY
jgi:hypothetical protein